MSAPANHRVDEHPGDGVLLALHDGEPGSGVAASRAHLERCAECRARVAVIARNSDHVHGALGLIQAPHISREDFNRRLARARGAAAVPVWRHPGWRVAAALVVLAGAAAASPMRHWFGRRRDTRPAAIDSVVLRPIPAVRAAESAGATVSFAATGTEFAIRFDSLPESGTLTARRSNDANITARIVSGAGTGGDALVVLPGELRVRNATTSRAAYELILPNAVTRLRVIVAGRSVFDGPPLVQLQLRPPR